MYEVGVIAHFEAAHRLRGDFGPATGLHGHTYRVELVVSGPELAEDGTLVDVGLLRQAAEAVTAQLHLTCLDEVAALAGVNTTAEQVASHISGEVLARLGQPPRLASLLVRVWESQQVFASHVRPLEGG